MLPENTFAKSPAGYHNALYEFKCKSVGPWHSSTYKLGVDLLGISRAQKHGIIGSTGVIHSKGKL